MAARSILVVSTLDTKGIEVAFLCDRLRALGAAPFVVDAGILGEPRGITPDVPSERVAAAAGSTLEIVRTASRGRAVAIMAQGLGHIVRSLHREMRFEGAIGIGGLEGALLAAAALTALPFGIPKVSVSPVFSGVRRFQPFVGASDVALLHSVADLQGLNAVTELVLDRAARMTVSAWPPRERAAPVLGRVGLSLNGNTTGVGTSVRRELESTGYEVVSFHSNGVGGVMMEELATEGELSALVDLTTNELTEEVVRGLFPVTGRLAISGRCSVPRVIVPGSMDFICQESGRVDPRFAGRPVDEHNPELVLVQVSPDEAAAVAQAMVDRLVRSTGPVRVVVPTRGLSLAGSPGGVFEGAGASGPLVDALICAANGRLPLVLVDAPINDPATCRAVVSAFEGVLSAVVPSAVVPSVAEPVLG